MKNNISLGAAVITQNHENYIESAIEALLDQTHNISNIMIVDDNSEDSTYSKVEKYSRRYSFIGCKKNQEVLGPSKSSNLALNFLQNEFILFTSGDDISYRDRARIQLEYFKKNSKLTCVINSVNVFSDDKSVNLSNIPKFSHSNVTGSELFKEMFWKQNFLNASASCFRKSNIGDNLFDSRFLYLQDYKLWLDLCINNEIEVGSELVLDYRVSTNSLSQKVNKDYLDSRSRMLDELLEINIEALDSLTNYDIMNLFNEQLQSYQKLDLSEIKKSSLIFFLLMSHQNVELRLKTLKYYKNSDIYPAIFNDLIRFFYISQHTIDRIKL